MDFKQPGMIYPGMWRYPKNTENCCIYRVPDCIRRVNPEAYTPQLVIIGPLHHYLISQPPNSLEDIANTKLMGYLNMEAHKKIYLAEFARRTGDEKIIDSFRRKIEKDEEIIRESYSESTAWIESPQFVDMILHDSVFIMEFILGRRNTSLEKTGDPLLDESCLANTIIGDLILLENQLPYFILEKLYDPIIPTLIPNKTFREIINDYFNLEDNIGRNSKFRHFTDLLRCVRVETETLTNIPRGIYSPVDHMYNTDMLDRGGVKFEVVDEDVLLYVRFEKGCLKMPCLRVDDEIEMVLRNIMALEQCHYPSNAHVCNYFIFLDYLVDSDKDVNLLVEKGIIKNWIGQPDSVADMVNKLCLGILDMGSHYSDIAAKVNAQYYSKPINRSCAILNRVYFGNLWTGTATVAATFLLVMTLIQTVASIIQVMQNT